MNRRDFLKLSAMFSAVLIVPSLDADIIPTKNYNLKKRIKREFERAEEHVGVDWREYSIVINGDEQELYLGRKNFFGKYRIVKTYDISTGFYGFSNEYKSKVTPTGLHRIDKKIGDGADIGTLFEKEASTGKIVEISTDKKRGRGVMVTRLLRLEGLFDENKTTAWRGIYIHGTNREGLLGTPASDGCIRMNNEDVIELYDKVKTGTPVNIFERIIP